MQSIGQNPLVARAASILALVGHVASVVLYIILPGLEVPYPSLYAFQAAWVIVLVVTIWSLRAHPWRSALIPLIGVVVVTVVRIYGEQHLGWRG